LDVIYRLPILVAPMVSVERWTGSGYYLSSVFFLLCLAAIAYYCYAIYAANRFFSQSVISNPDFHPPISILKPICGVDSRTYENLGSFCQQDYPNYQIIFGVQDRQDASLKVVKQIIHDFPQVDIQFVISDRPLGENRKVGNLVNAMAKAKHDILILADSDVHVQPNYLQQVVQPLSDASVGTVTCLYRSFAEGWVAALEALSAATEFHAGVLVSNQLEGTRFALGQTIVIRRSVLEVIGGLEGIANYLADDFQLGYRSAQAGFQVVLSHYVVEHVLPACTLLDSLQRQIRWMLVIRVSRTWGYVGLIFTYGTVSSLLLLMATGGAPIGWIVLATTWSMRLFMAWLIGVKKLNDPVTKRLFWLVPLRDCMSVALWCYGFLVNTIKWRDRPFKLAKGGKLVALSMERRPSRVPSTIN